MSYYGHVTLRPGLTFSRFLQILPLPPAEAILHGVDFINDYVILREWILSRILDQHSARSTCNRELISRIPLINVNSQNIFLPLRNLSNIVQRTYTYTYTLNTFTSIKQY